MNKMNKLILSIAIGSLSLSAFANLEGDGFYRVKNFGSDRWASLIDNKGEIDKTATSADLHAVKLTRNTEEILSDPGSIVYINNLGGSEYNFAAQGTSVAELIGYKVNFGTDGTAPDGQTLYRIFGRASGATKYIGDGDMVPEDIEGFATISTISNANYMKWYVLPINTETNYLGAVPTVEAEGKLYNTLYTSFSYKPYSEGVKAYYIGRVGGGQAEIIEISGVVPGACPVIIECAGPDAADNKLSVLSPQGSIADNSLTGVYFDYYYSKNLNNRVVYDPATMRVLGVCSDGSLGFITDKNLVSIPANSAYLEVPEGSEEEFKCVSSEEFSAGVNSITSDNAPLRYSNGKIHCGKSTEITVVNIAGQTVARTYGETLDLNNLSKGVYIAKAAGKSIKIMIN